MSLTIFQKGLTLSSSKGLAPIIKANISLTQKTELNESIQPPGVLETYYEAIVNKLYNVSIKAEPCE